MAPALLFDDLNLALASGAFSASLVVLFMVRGIHRTYPVFFCFCIFDLSNDRQNAALRRRIEFSESFLKRFGQ